MELQSRTIYQDVIQEDKDKLTQQWTQDVIHQALKGGRGVGKAKTHDPKLKMPMVSLKSCFVFILDSHPYLVIPRPHVQLGEIFCTSQFF